MSCEHVIELYLDGHKTIAQTILFAPGQSYHLDGKTGALAGGYIGRITDRSWVTAAAATS